MDTRCVGCGKPIDENAPRARVGRRIGEKVDVYYLHLSCFELKKHDFDKEDWATQLPDDFEVKDKQEASGEDKPRLADIPKEVSAEARAEEHKKQAMAYFSMAQDEKSGDMWLKLVNDPACYFAARHILSLKGVDMNVEQFEELAAVFLVLMKRATADRLRSAHENEMKRAD